MERAWCAAPAALVRLIAHDPHAAARHGERHVAALELPRHSELAHRDGLEARGRASAHPGGLSFKRADATKLPPQRRQRAWVAQPAHAQLLDALEAGAVQLAAERQYRRDHHIAVPALELGPDQVEAATTPDVLGGSSRLGRRRKDVLLEVAQLERIERVEQAPPLVDCDRPVGSSMRAINIDPPRALLAVSRAAWLRLVNGEARVAKRRAVKALSVAASVARHGGVEPTRANTALPKRAVTAGGGRPPTWGHRALRP